MSSLMHHGVKGQRWGVRRFQNKDGTRTAAGKRQQKMSKIRKQNEDIRSIYKSLSDKDLEYLEYSKDEIKNLRKTDFRDRVDGSEEGTIHRVVTKDKNGVPVSYADATAFTSDDLETGKKMVKILSIDIATRAGDDYRGKGYAVDSGKKMVEWFDKYGYKEYDHMEWFAKANNIGSQKTAEKAGFKRMNYVYEHMKNDGTDGWVGYSYRKKIKHTSIGGTMYIEGNALILGDSSYLEHHGIRGQRWGVRRFQNQDGSLTNAGRKRLGYATKGAAQTVGKAFKAGVKAGGKAVKAVKAHHEKAEAKKIEKKKEKASKTRLGVMANKDLFTNEELKKLNDRFKLEDEMKMATLQKGVEIAKAVGTIAQNVGTVAKTYEDVTGQSLSPIKRKAAEEKARQDAEDRERRIAREDADEARKAAKEERDIAIHEQTLRKAIAAADTQEFTAQKTKAEADSSVIDAIKKGQEFNGGSDATGQSWMEKATSGGKNPFEQMKYDSDPEYRAAKDAHDAKVEQQRHEQERDARIAAREKEAAAKQSQPQAQQKQGGGDDDALFSQKGSLPIDKDRYRNNRAMEKAKQVKEDAAEERAKKQDEKAAKATIDDMMEARRQFTDSARANSDGAFDRETAANYIKGKAKELPSKLNPINAIAKKITDKALKEQEAASRKAMEDEYKKTSRLQGRDEANYTMYYNRVNALQAQGYSERQAKKVADTESPFSSKRNRRFEYNEKVGEIETTHRKNSKEINKAEKASSDKYYELRNKPGYEWGTPKREALERKFAEQQATIAKLREDNDAMLDRERKKAKKILEHSLSIQNGVLFIDSSDGFTHHGVKGQRWGVRRFQNEDGSLTPKGRKHYEKKIAKYEDMLKQADMEEGMYSVENGTLFINAGEPYLEHHGVKGMKWGKHLMAGKGVDAEGGGGGGFAEDDEKLKAMAKKAGMSVAEYRTKMAGKLSGAASKVGEKVYDAAGGEYKQDYNHYRKKANDALSEQLKYERKRDVAKAEAASEWRKAKKADSEERYGDSQNHVNKRNEKQDAAKAYNRIATKAHNERNVATEMQNKAKDKYEKSLAGRAEAAGKRVRNAGNELSAKASAAKKRLKDIPGELYGSKHRKDFERNARLLEGSTRSAVEIGRDTYKRHGPTSGFGDPTYKATDDAYKRANKQWNKVRISGQKYDRSIAKRVDSLVRKASKARKTTEQKKLFSGTSPKAKKAVIAKKKATPTSYEKRVNDAKNSVEKAARSNEAAYKHAIAVYRQTGSDSDAYKQAIKRSRTTLQRSLENQKRLRQKKRRSADIGKKRAKHFDDTNSIYTEGTRLVINSKWG